MIPAAAHRLSACPVGRRRGRRPLDRSRAYVAAGALFLDDVGRVLLVQPTYKDYWDIPGGYVETGETPAQTAAREVRDELGIETAAGPLLVADWAPHPGEGCG